MGIKILSLLLLFSSSAFIEVTAQTPTVQQGLILKRETSIRLGSIQVLNKRTKDRARSSTLGVFSIKAAIGDTLNFGSDNYQLTNFVVTDFTDKVIYMAPVIQLNEVIIKENSLKRDIAEVQQGYRKQSVFYTGTPHYYYLFVKPMTFIYENFKGEVIDARRFNRYARKELAAFTIAARFNTASIKAVVPIKDSELEDFKLNYAPTVDQINQMRDYDLINYIRKSYGEFMSNFNEEKRTRIEPFFFIKQ